MSKYLHAVGDYPEFEKELAQVEDADLRLEEGVFMSMMVSLKYAAGGQAFVVGLDNYDKARERRVLAPEGADWIRRTYDFFKVRSLRDAVGKHVYALRKPGRNTNIEGLLSTGLDGPQRALLVRDCFPQPQESR